MLDKEKVKTAKLNVNNYISDGLLKKLKKKDKNILNTYIKNSEESLKVANFLFDKKLSSLWVIVSSYYSMYYIANAVIYKLGYKVGHKISHKVTSDCLIVFVRKKLKQKFLNDFEEAKEDALDIVGVKADEVIQSFDFERSKRGKFQYNMSEKVKEQKSKTSLKRAKKFVFEMQKLLDELQ